MVKAANRIARAREFASFLVTQRLRGFDVPEEPHFDPEFDALFRELLRNAESYLEFGSGGSTLLADRFGKTALAVETDRFFARAVRKKLSLQTRVRIEAVDIGLTGAWGVPIPGKPTPARTARWRAYVDRPFELLSVCPDLALVDGRFRRACALRVARQANIDKRPVTIMFDDYYSEGRDHYRIVEKILGTPERIGRGAVFKPIETLSVAEHEISSALEDYR